MLVDIAVEGSTDTPVARRIVEHCGLIPDAVYEKGGKSGLDARLHGYNAAALRKPWLVIRDLDTHSCPVDLALRLLPEPAARMCFRVAVRQMDAWLLADAASIARYLGIGPQLIPDRPDELPFPKRSLVALAARSPRRTIREDFAPAAGSTASVGPGYTARIAEFAAEHWRPGIAAKSSPSLARCLRALRRINP